MSEGEPYYADEAVTLYRGGARMNPTDPNSPRIGRRTMAAVHLIGA